VSRRWGCWGLSLRCASVAKEGRDGIRKVRGGGNARRESERTRRNEGGLRGPGDGGRILDGGMRWRRDEHRRIQNLDSPLTTTQPSSPTRLRIPPGESEESVVRSSSSLASASAATCSASRAASASRARAPLAASARAARRLAGSGNPVLYRTVLVLSAVAFAYVELAETLEAVPRTPGLQAVRTGPIRDGCASGCAGG
jgi:hypothetical protein